MIAPGSKTAIVLTLGDPRGIGPEVVMTAARRHLASDANSRILVVGPERFSASDLPYQSVGVWDETERGAGEISAEAIRVAVGLAMEGRFGGVVTGPIHKGAFAAAGIPHPGHTEFLQELSGAETVGMLMAAEKTHLGPPLRVLLATIHVALRAAPDLLTTELLVRQTTLLNSALRDYWGIAEPRLALCALNPHASDGGLFGDEEERVFGPAVSQLASTGLSVAGPLPADTVFTRALEGDFDAVVAPYHDVGMAAFKTASFGRGVNVTLGLPFVRTSPDHGTAFDIAGTGRADPSSTQEALELALQLARR